MQTSRPALVVVEGLNDVEFLLRIARVLHKESAIPDSFDTAVTANRVLFLPIGGGIHEGWWSRLAPLECSEFHLLDAEVEPETTIRRLLIERILARPNCQARLMSKRSLENYLHPAAIRAAGGGVIDFGDHDCVAERFVQQRHGCWDQMSRKTRQRLKYRAKKWLNSMAVDHMTAAMLADRDPVGEVIEWLSAILTLAAAN